MRGSSKVTYISATAVSMMGLCAMLRSGFYFAEEMYPFVAAWLALWTAIMGYMLLRDKPLAKLLKRPGGGRLKRDGNVLFILGSPFLISSLYAFHGMRGPISAQGTMDEFLRWSFYGTFAVLTYISATSRGSARVITVAWHMMGMVLSMSALLSICADLRLPNFIAFSSAPDVSVTGARLGGLLQYPNTFGAVMAVFLLERLFAVGYEVRERMDNPKTGTALLRLLPLFPYTAALLLSESRGAWLAAACACAAAALPLKRRLLAPLLAAGAAPVAAAALLYRQLTAARLAVEPLPGLLTLAGLWAGALLAGLWLYRRQRSTAAWRARLVLAALGWTAAGIAVLLHVHARIAGPSSTVSARALLYRDAWRLAAEAPWLGRGGETWRSMYLSAQSHPYVGSQVHSGYLDILLNIGIIGLAATVIMLAATGWMVAVTSFRLLPSFLVIVLHSAVDFDWSFGLVWLLLFWLPALAVASQAVTPVTPVTLDHPSGRFMSTNLRSTFLYSRRILAGAVCISSMLLCLTAWQVHTGFELYRKAEGVSASAIEKKLLLEQALYLNPLSTHTAVALSQQLPREQGISLLKQSLDYSPNSPALNWGMAQLFMEQDSPGALLYWVRRSLKVDVYNYVTRTQSIQGFLHLGQHKLKDGDIQGAKLSAESGLELLRQYKLIETHAVGGGYNDRSFHLTGQAISLGHELELLLIHISAG